MSWLACMEVSTEIAFANNIFDSYNWHNGSGTVFPENPIGSARFSDPHRHARRIISAVDLVAQSPTCPHWCPPESFAVREIAPSFLAHRYYAFDLRANPVKCLVQRDEQGNETSWEACPADKTQ